MSNSQRWTNVRRLPRLARRQHPRPSVSAGSRPAIEPLERRLLLGANPLIVQDGLFDFLGAIAEGLDGELFGIQIPLIGDALQEGGNFFNDLQTKVDAAFLDLEEDPPLPGNEHIQRAVFDAWRGELNVLVLDDANSDGVVNWEDISVFEDETQVRFDVHLATIAYEYEEEFDVEFNSGFDILKLSAEGNVDFSIGFSFDFTFGVIKPYGSDGDQVFYVDTAAENEIAITLDASIPDFQAEGTFGFLTVIITDEDKDDDVANNTGDLDLNKDGNPDSDLDGDGLQPSALGAVFRVDIQDLGHNDDRLTQDEIDDLNIVYPLADIVDVRLTGNLTRSIDGYDAVAPECLVDLNLHLNINFGELDELVFGNQSTGSMYLPHFTTEFRLAWFLSERVTETLHIRDQLDTIPVVEFNNITLSLGEFISDFTRPILLATQFITAPTKPIRDFLNAPLPIISDLAGQDITLIELVGLVPKYGELFVALNNIQRALDKANAFSDDISFNFGSFQLFGDLREYNKLEEAGENIISNLSGLTGIDLVGLGQDNFGWLTNQGQYTVGGLSFPILTDINEVVQLLLGGDARFFELNLPELAFDFHGGMTLPIFPPFLNVGLDMYFSAGIRFGFGFDSYGLRLFAEDDYQDPSLITKGFYISDHHLPDGTDLPEAWLEASVSGSAFAGVPMLIKAGVKGGITGDIGLDFHDIDGDGRMRFDELQQRLGTGNPFCIFDAHGSLDGYFAAFVWVGIDLWLFTITIYEDTWVIASDTFLDFNWSCTDEPDPPVLGEVLGDTLYLNMGPRAPLRLRGCVEDRNESFTVRKRYVDDIEKLVVGALGFEQEFDAAGIEHIYAEGGDGDDRVRIIDSAEDPIAADALLYGDYDTTDGYGPTGEYGDDKLYAGVLGATMYGGPGDDRLRGNEGIDRLFGGLGDDQLTGDQSDDELFGGGGDDFIKGDEGDDLLDGGAGNDRLYGYSGSDVIIGGAGDDILKGSSGDDDLNGGTGDDHIFGSSGADTLRGGAGQDELDGGTGDDVIYGELDRDIVFGNRGDDLLYGDAGDDLMFGDNGAVNDATLELALLYKVDEDGRLILDEQGQPIPADEGDTWTITFNPAEGSDTLHGGADNDVLFGDNGLIILDDEGHVDQIVVMFPEVYGDDNLYGGTGDDVLVGGRGDEVYYFADNFGVDEVRETPEAGFDTMDFTAVTVPLDFLFGSITVTDGAGGEVTHDGEHIEKVVGSSTDDVFSFEDGVAIDIYLDGGPGSDTLDYSRYTTSVEVNLGEGRATGVLGGAAGGVIHFENATGGSADDLLVGDDNANILVGNAGDDWLIGLGGDDTLDGGSEDDIMNGGTGDDLYIEAPGSIDAIFDAAGTDWIDFSGATMAIRLDLRRDNGRGQRIDKARNILSLSGEMEKVTGTPFDDWIMGNDAANMIDGLGGDDFLNGWRGDDDLYGGGGDDRLFGFHGEDMLDGQDGDDWLKGQQDGDVLYGGAGNDRLEGQADADELHGQDGDDLLLGGGGADLLNGGGGQDDLRGQGGDDWLDGEAGDDRLFGNGGSDVLVGSAGQDLLNGGGGFDSAYYGQDPAGVSVDLGARLAFDGFGQTDTLSGVEGAIGSAYDDVLIGSGGRNRLVGGDGSDTLSAGGGSDVLIGSAGEDTLLGQSGNDLILWSEGDGDDLINGGSGRDILQADTDPDKGAQLTLGGATGVGVSAGSFAVNARGVEDLVINTGAMADEITLLDLTGSGLQRITMNLGGGNDFVDGQATAVAMNVLGGAGDDFFIGGGGNDRFDGGDGLDVMDYSLCSAAVNLRIGGRGRDGMGGSDLLRNLETVIGTPFDDRITGDRRANTLVGGAGNDTLVGGGGNDTLYGGAGLDRLLGGFGADRLFGDEGDDLLRGGGGGDLLNGGDDNDVLYGQGNDDILFGADGDDVLWGGAGGDELNGGAGQDKLFGGGNDDVLAGGHGDDMFDGNAGFDLLDFTGATAKVSIDVDAGTAEDGLGGHDRFRGMEGAFGSDFSQEFDA